MQPGACAHRGTGSQHSVGPDPGALAHHGTGTDDGTGLDDGAGGHPRIRMDMGPLGDAGRRPGIDLGVEPLRQARIGAVRVGIDQQVGVGRQVIDQARRDDVGHGMAGMGGLALLGPHQETDALGIGLPEAGQATYRHGRIATQFGAQDLGDLRQGYRGLKVPFHEVLCSPEMLDRVRSDPTEWYAHPPLASATPLCGRHGPRHEGARFGQVHHTRPAGQAGTVHSRGGRPWGMTDQRAALSCLITLSVMSSLGLT